MADCDDIPSNLNDPLLESLFKAADTEVMKTEEKENYMKSIIGEAELAYYFILVNSFPSRMKAPMA